MLNNGVFTEVPINKVEKPTVLSARQTDIAKKYVNAKMLEGFTVTGFCEANSLSTKSLYEWLRKPEFETYINELQKAITPENEKDAYNHIKQHILRLAYKETPSIKEVELFLQTFPYLAELDKQETMQRLGLTNETSTKSDNRTVEERKAVLLSRLKG